MKRRAFTLVELLLVLAIMVVVLSVAMPTYDGMISSRRIFNAVESVQIAIQKARVDAIRSGQAQAFRCHLGQREYSIEPWLKASDSTDAGAGATVTTLTGQAFKTESTAQGVTSDLADTSSTAKTVEEGVTFADAQIVTDVRSMSEQTTAGGLVAATSGWSQPILLYPDGSSTTAHIVLQDSKGRRMAVQLRGLTGQVTTVEVASGVSQ